jgi:glycosyltransferase involved in cell wall biosynthesis
VEPKREKSTLQSRKELALAHLNADRIEEGLKIYAMILRDYPEDVESYIVIGDCYLAQGETETAAQLYSYALELSPGNGDIQRRLRLARVELATPASVHDEALVPDLKTIGHLLQRIIGHSNPVTDEDLKQAAQFLDEIKHSHHPALAVAERLSEIEALIPALLELNVQQARSEGRPDLAHALDGLLVNVRSQLSEAQTKEHQPTSTGSDKPGAYSTAGVAKPRLLFLTPASNQISPRVYLPLQSLAGRGFQTTLVSKPGDYGTNYDVVIAANPHGDPSLMPVLATCSGVQIPIIVDLDNDFTQVPNNHPIYLEYRLDLPEKMRAYTAALLMADRITVPSVVLAETLTAAGHPARVIPDGWMRHNGLWEKGVHRRHTINIGWIGPGGQVEDMAMIRRMVLRIMREFPNTQLVIGGDVQVYQLFDRLPESRRLYLPPFQTNDYPYLLGQVDILLVPMCDTPFNRCQSDRRLVEAGARRLPWIASPIPAFVTWEAGGFIANTPDEWFSHMRQLVLDPNLRSTLSQAGWRKAESREMGNLTTLWLDLVTEMLPVQCHVAAGNKPRK